MSPEEIVDAQIRAYEAGDLPAFLSTYADDVRCEDLPSRRLLAEGHEGVAAVWGPMFARGRRKVEILRRIVHGAFVTDHEAVEHLADGARQRAVAIYWVVSQRIQAVWFLREPPEGASQVPLTAGRT